MSKRGMPSGSQGRRGNEIRNLHARDGGTEQTGSEWGSHWPAVTQRCERRSADSGQWWTHRPALILLPLLPLPGARGRSWRKRGGGQVPPPHLVQPLLPSQQLLLKGALQPLGLQLLPLLLDELVSPPVLQDALQLGLAVHAQAPAGRGAVRRPQLPQSATKLHPCCAAAPLPSHYTEQGREAPGTSDTRASHRCDAVTTGPQACLPAATRFYVI